jgi:hypothetical protein
MTPPTPDEIAWARRRIYAIALVPVATAVLFITAALLGHPL